jgi:hypothetical protein
MLKIILVIYLMIFKYIYIMEEYINFLKEVESKVMAAKLRMFLSNDYYDDDCSIDKLSMHNDDIKHYNQLEIDEMYKQHYHFSWCIGKNVMNTDAYWFTSDELEAFSVIWQRRISAV